MNVLLIGGTGVISSDVCKTFLDKGINVDTLTRGKRTEFLDPRANNLFIDISDRSEFQKCIENKKYDYVIDFLVGIPGNMISRLEVLKDRCDTYVYISTATVFTPTDNEITEESTIGNRKWDYASNKEDAENWLKTHAKDYVNHYLIIRPYVTYSKQRLPYALMPRDQYTLLNRIKNQKAVPIQDGGDIKFSITHSSDFAKALVQLVGEKKQDDSYNIVSNTVTTWKEVMEQIYIDLDMPFKMANVSSDNIIKVFHEFKDVLLCDKSHSWVFNNKKIVEDTGVEFETILNDGIKEAVDYYNSQKIEKVDYIWEGKLDRLLYVNRKHLKGLSKTDYTLKGNKEVLKPKDKIYYWIGRNKVGYDIYLFANKVYRHLS